MSMIICTVVLVHDGYCLGLCPQMFTGLYVAGLCWEWEFPSTRPLIEFPQTLLFRALVIYIKCTV